jgi:hypothetical protein
VAAEYTSTAAVMTRYFILQSFMTIRYAGAPDGSG